MIKWRRETDDVKVRLLETLRSAVPTESADDGVDRAMHFARPEELVEPCLKGAAMGLALGELEEAA